MGSEMCIRDSPRAVPPAVAAEVGGEEVAPAARLPRSEPPAAAAARGLGAVRKAVAEPAHLPG